MGAKSKTLTRVDDKNVYSLWKCPDCGRDARWSFSDVADGGQPFCTHCECDMEFTGKVFVVSATKK